MGGFLSGFGSGLQRSAELEQQAILLKKQEMQKAQLKLAELLLGGDDEQRKQGLAIIMDPEHPFSMDKPHPKLKEAENLAQALGAGAAGQAVAGGSPAGMAGMLSPDQSPLVQSGMGTIGDQGSGEPLPGVPPGVPPPGPAPAPPAPAPALPPQPAAMTTNPPATQGGQISPQAAAGGAPPPPPQGMPAPAPAPAPPPPAPPENMGAAISAFEAQGAPPAPGLNSAQQQEWYKEVVKNSTILRRAKALQAAGASAEEIRATLAGREGTQVITTGMRGDVTRDEGEANRASRERMSAARVEAMGAQVQMRIAESKARREQDWAKHLDNLGVSRQRLAKSGSGRESAASTARAERRLEKLQDKGLEIRNFADNGISGVENLRGLYQLYESSDSVKEKVIAWERFADAAAGEAARITGAMTGMGVKGVRQTEARVKAAVKEITTTHKSWIPGYPPIPTLAPKEIEIRLDNVRHLVEDAERQARDGIEQIASSPVKVGDSPLQPMPDRPRAGGAEAVGTAPPTGKGIPPGAKTATNPKTGQKVYSTDGGKTWLDALTGATLH